MSSIFVSVCLETGIGKLSVKPCINLNFAGFILCEKIPKILSSSEYFSILY